MKSILIFASGVVLGAAAAALSRKNSLSVVCMKSEDKEEVSLPKLISTGLDFLDKED